MQAEAGQPLELILRRKELEREVGGGVFYWGVGNALGRTLHDFVSAISNPEVIFSVMKSKPKREDESPTSLYLWNGFSAADGSFVEFPPHVLLLSRGDTKGGRKSQHYALVCESEFPLDLADGENFDYAHLRNFGGNRARLGHSQVTAIVTYNRTEETTKSYGVAFRARLKDPHFVKLARPTVLAASLHKTIGEFLLTSPTPEKWGAFVSSLRHDANSADG